MSGELITCPLSAPQLAEELTWLVEIFSRRGIESCDVLFGYAWGNEYYLTAQWEYECVAIDQVAVAVSAVEIRGLGRLGQDDLWLRVADPQVEYRFCNDSDLHLAFSEANWLVDLTRARWQQKGYLLG